MVNMTSAKSSKSNLQRAAIDREVISQIDDDTAWEEQVFVPPSEAPRPHWMRTGKHLEFAAKFHVLSVLHRLGAEANLTLVQPDSVDIIVVRESGQAVTIDVKTLAGTTSWHVEHFRPRKHHYIVFVSFAREVEEPDAPPRVFVASSRRLEQFVNKSRAQSVSMDELSEHLSVANPWQQLVSESAA
jgi:hypothetical protein